MGYYYMMGDGVEMDEAKGLEFFRYDTLNPEPFSTEMDEAKGLESFRYDTLNPET
jgi:hypothetical protein